MEPVVKVQNISKRYQIGGLDAGYRTFRETFAEALARPVRRLQGRGKPTGETIWALKDVDFVVQEGEILGLIGHNGAGKSTLLKILSRITTPTTGRTEVRGRIGSLLEVGTGFHPDLTGRENVFLNGALIGIPRSHIARKFDEIVAFSGIEPFIDTPVKWYSSGMYVRLAFSVAVHLDTEVLVMDEVLAVGDVGFQQKCLDKMYEIKNQGRTILFVSHNMASVTRLCQRAILLEQGLVTKDGPAHQVVNEYMGQSWQAKSQHEWTAETAPTNGIVRLRRVRVRDEAGATSESIDIRSPVGIEMEYDVLQPGEVFVPKIDLYNDEGVHVFAAHDVGSEWRQRPRVAGSYVSTAWIPGNFLSEGNVLVSVELVSHAPATAIHVQVAKAVVVQVLDRQFKDSARGDFVGPIPGVIRPLLRWTTDVQTPGEQPLSEETMIPG
jgi:lipopolysaccharide transport system ATP-binding protein